MSNSPRRKAIKRQRWVARQRRMAEAWRAQEDRDRPLYAAALDRLLSRQTITTTDNEDGTFTHTMRIEP